MNKISEGRTAEIFEHDHEKVIKLYRTGFPAEAVNYEYEVNQMVAHLGIPSPIAYEVVDMDQRKGIVFERIEGTTLLRRSVQMPSELERLTYDFTQLHYRIHQTEIDAERWKGTTMLRQKMALEHNIRGASLLSNDVKQQILDDLERLPDGASLCHGDFHPDNVMSGDRAWIIDWMTAMIGNPAGDVARTLLLFRFGTLPDEAPKNVIDALEQLRAKINDSYLAHYLSLSGLQYSDIDEWMLPVAAARLSEWIPDAEKAALLHFIEDRLR
ncbi:phosphotransferase family protein [Paenibacillus cremeus]|uniref:Phosphotransferase n=1 Tax=Paenibacillus cremeus TaxID=2163881 RepID=A0A559KGJ0_9BACL|nr:aminoglycoside phosphotransferase family protein [Paenibacillus cremeus]TVY11243.1 phosphotransferase [Paenibacillus cremeus]